MAKYPEERFMEILEMLINRAYKNAKSEKQHPIIFSMILNSPAIEWPIEIPARSKEQNSVEAIIRMMDWLEVSILIIILNNEKFKGIW